MAINRSVCVRRRHRSHGRSRSSGTESNGASDCEPHSGQQPDSRDLRSYPQKRQLTLPSCILDPACGKTLTTCANSVAPSGLLKNSGQRPNTLVGRRGSSANRHSTAAPGGHCVHDLQPGAPLLQQSVRGPRQSNSIACPRLLLNLPHLPPTSLPLVGGQGQITKCDACPSAHAGPPRCLGRARGWSGRGWLLGFRFWDLRLRGTGRGRTVTWSSLARISRHHLARWLLLPWIEAPRHVVRTTQSLFKLS